MEEKFRNALEGIFVCPKTKKGLNLVFENNQLVSLKNNEVTYSAKDGVISFVSGKNYVSNFGDQWLKFRKTQLDSFNGSTLSEDRFFGSTGWSRAEIQGKLILDVGCGAGRFAEIALKHGAYVIAIDYSESVYAAYENLKSYPNFLVLKANIYELPFLKQSFDYIYSLGVLQHTPDPEKAFKCLPQLLKLNGSICVDYYWKRFREIFKTKYYVRLVTRFFNENQIYNFLFKHHSSLYKISNAMSSIPVFGKFFIFLVPVKNYKFDYPELNDKQLEEWSFLDTYDNWAPMYDKPQTKSKILKFAQDEMLDNIELLHAGHLVLRAKKKEHQLI